ncbi:sensor histidine kinase, partial [Streptomyces sp. URMC 124]
MEERKKSLELKVLQSQIAPHFLYNTLATIGSLARQQRITEVNKTIRALVGVLEFTFDRVSEYVSVREELKGLELYM